MNVVSFSKFGTARQVEAHQASLPRVILEGRDDVELFQRWFPDLNEDLEFIEARKVGEGGGCTAVAPAVQTSREVDGIPAVGIVDRDAWHRQHRWDVVFATDETVFAQEARTDAIYTTSLWEVEAYLLRPELLGEWVDAQRRDLPAPAAERAAALQKTLEECEALLASVPHYSSAHGVGRRAPEQHLRNVRHADLPAACAKHLEPRDEVHQGLVEEIARLVASIQAEAPQEPSERLVFLLRYVDTKRLLARLVLRLKLRPAAHWGLASLMSGKALRPSELEAFLEATAERWAA